MDKFYVVTFSTTSAAIQGEAAFKAEGIKQKTIPTPREISVSCGLAIKFSLEDFEDVDKKLLKSGKIHYSGIYDYTKSDEGNKAVLLDLD